MALAKNFFVYFSRLVLENDFSRLANIRKFYLIRIVGRHFGDKTEKDIGSSQECIDCSKPNNQNY